ncbi:hypothetical protein SFC23_16550 [Shouchella clausii]
MDWFPWRKEAFEKANAKQAFSGQHTKVPPIKRGTQPVDKVSVLRDSRQADTNA